MTATVSITTMVTNINFTTGADDAIVGLVHTGEAGVAQMIRTGVTSVLNGSMTS